MIINAHKVCLKIGPQVIFEDLSFNFDSYDRVGLVGRNGSGKSTLLKMIAGQQALDGGTIGLARGKKIAYLPQEVVMQSNKSVIDETCTTFAHLAVLQEEQRELEKQLHERSDDHDVIDRYAQVCEQLMHLDPERAQAEAKRVLMGLGFKPESFDQPVSTLSGGWKMRVVLAKLLLQKADFYLLDEPTNHLDIVSQEWFLQFLKQASFGFMIVCHDRYFLNELCSTILELERGAGTLYAGNYATYEKQKAHNEAMLEMAYKNQQREIQSKKETIERFRAKASKAKMAQSMIKALDKIELIELPPKPSEMKFNFPPVQQSGRIALQVQNVAQTFGEKKVFKDVSFDVERSKKIAIIAPNGVGKTTLFNVIVGKLPLQTGSIELGHNVQAVVFDQDQTAALDLEKTILENIQQACPKILEQKIRSFAGSFLFGKDAINKKIKVLSGGEKNRVGMMKVLLQNANLLLLDEPTNHLDIQSKDILLTALQAHQGTIIFVSHDHDFVSNLATDIIELRADGASLYPGTYELYLYRKKQEQDALDPKKQHVSQNNATAAQCAKDAEKLRELQKQSKTLERKVEKLEQWIKDVENSFAKLTYGTQPFTDAENKLQQLRKQHGQANSEWEAITAQLEN